MKRIRKSKGCVSNISRDRWGTFKLATGGKPLLSNFECFYEWETIDRVRKIRNIDQGWMEKVSSNVNEWLLGPSLNLKQQT